MNKKSVKKVDEEIEFKFEVLKEGLLETLVSSVETINIGEYLEDEKITYSPEEIEAIKDDFFRFHIFVHLFNGNISYWINYLVTQASEKIIKDTLPFVLHLKDCLEKDAELLERIKNRFNSDDVSLKVWEDDDVATISQFLKENKLKNIIST